LEIPRTYNIEEKKDNWKAGVNALNLYNSIKHDKEVLEFYFFDVNEDITTFINQYEEVLLLFRFSFNIPKLEGGAVTTFRIGKIIKIHDFVISKHNETNSKVFERVHKLLNKFIEESK
jgi:hypothetical protein